MREEKTEYIKIPGRGLRRGESSLFVRTRARLYMGKDHLLCLYSTGYTEEYKRFYYKDIQAIVASKTSTGKARNIVYAVSAVLSALLSFLVDAPWTIMFWIFTGLFLLFLFINWISGPTCICYLYTAVTREKLPSLNRLKNAIKAMNLLRPVIEKAQGELTSEEIKVKIAEAPKIANTDIKPQIKPITTSQQYKYNGKIHEILFYLLLLGGLQTIADFFLNHLAIIFLNILTGSVIGIFAIISVIKQSGSNMKGGLLVLPWTILGFLFFSFMINYSIYAFTAIKNPAAMRNQLELLSIYANLSPYDNTMFMGFYIFSIIYLFITGILGLFLLRKFRRETEG